MCRLEVWDWDRFAEDTMLGFVEISLGTVVKKKKVEGWLPLTLEGRSKEDKGEKPDKPSLRVSISMDKRASVSVATAKGLQLTRLVKRGEVDKVRKALQESGLALSEVDDRGRTPLHRACELEIEEADEIISLFLAHPKVDSIMGFKDNTGNTPLLCFCNHTASNKVSTGFSSFWLLAISHTTAPDQPTQFHNQ